MEELSKYGDADDPLFPWRIICIGVISQRSPWARAETVADIMFERWPEPIALKDAEAKTLIAVLMPLGMAIRKAVWLRAICKHYIDWMEEDWVPDHGAPGPSAGLIGFWPGVGPKTLELYVRTVKEPHESR